MPHDFYLLSGVILAGTAAVAVTVLLLDRWLVRVFAEDRPRLRRPLRVLKIKKPRYEPPVPKWCVVNPNDEGAEKE